MDFVAGFFACRTRIRGSSRSWLGTSSLRLARRVGRLGLPQSRMARLWLGRLVWTDHLHRLLPPALYLLQLLSAELLLAKLGLGVRLSEEESEMRLYKLNGSFFVAPAIIRETGKLVFVRGTVVQDEDIVASYSGIIRKLPPRDLPGLKSGPTEG